MDVLEISDLTLDEMLNLGPDVTLKKLVGVLGRDRIRIIKSDTGKSEATEEEDETL